MPALVPHRFLVRLAHPCPFHKAMPLAKGDALLDLPESAKLSNFAELDGKSSFADLRLAWNEFGLGIQLTVAGKKQDPQGDAERPRSADGLSLWLDTRDARTSHRASRYCHQFHFLPIGGGPDKAEPAAGQTKINRALQDAALADGPTLPFRHHLLKGGAIGWKHFCRRPHSPGSIRTSTRAGGCTTTSATKNSATSTSP